MESRPSVLHQQSVPAIKPVAFDPRAEHRRRVALFIAQGVTSISATMMNIGLFFYMQHRFGWGAAKNYQLAAAQGAVYIVGALLAGRLVARFGRQRWIVIAGTVLAVLQLLATLTPSPLAVAALTIAYSFVAASIWPAYESLCISPSDGQAVDAHAMSRSTAIYNLTWSGAGALAVACSGVVMEHLGPGYFALAAALQVVSIAFMVYYGPRESAAAHHHEDPPAELVRSRTLAMWLARVAMPATYVVVYGLSAAMPELPVLADLSTSARTVVSSFWLAGRWVAFLILGLTVFWHVRPRLLLGATLLMVVAFIGVTIRTSTILGPTFAASDLPAMIAWQLILGFMLGVIYSASLYFGMVLSQGSTEHGGYHEALIGLGCVLGPGAGALAAAYRPGDLAFGISAVTTLLCLTAVATVAVNHVAGKKQAAA